MRVLYLAGGPKLQGNSGPLGKAGRRGDPLRPESLVYDRELYWWEDSKF